MPDKKVNILLVMLHIPILFFIFLALLSGCTDTGYHQPVYIISDTAEISDTAQEEQEKDEETIKP